MCEEKKIHIIFVQREFSSIFYKQFCSIIKENTVLLHILKEFCQRDFSSVCSFLWDLLQIRGELSYKFILIRVMVILREIFSSQLLNHENPRDDCSSKFKFILLLHTYFMRAQILSYVQNCYAPFPVNL